MGRSPICRRSKRAAKELDARSGFFFFRRGAVRDGDGRMAFTGNTSAIIFDSVLHKTPTSATRMNETLPAELDRIIDKALEKDRALRYQSAAEMLADLKRLRRDSSSARIEVAPERPAPAKSRTALWAACALAILALAAGGAWLWMGRSNHQEISSVAVMPFVNASNDPNSEYLSDGITESLIDNLSELPNLTVLARSSVSRYKGRDFNPEAVAKELKVQALVTGRIVQRGEQLIISSELIDARSNRNLWGEQYDRKLSDVLAVQKEITQAISARLRERLSGEAKTRIAKGSTNDPEAYQLYLKGIYYWSQRTPQSLEKSKDYFSQAIAKDPGYADAYAGLADYYVAAPDYEPIPENEAAPKAKAAAEKALAIDTSSANAHAALAAAQWSLFDFADAETEFKRALDLNPSLGTAQHWFGLFLSWENRDEEALSHLRRAVELDPLNLQYNTNVGQGLCNAHQYDACIDQLKKTLEIDGNFSYTHSMLSLAYRDSGKPELWLEEWKRSATLANDEEELKIAEGAAKAYSQSGLEGATKNELELRKQLAKRRYVDPAQIALDYAYLGDKEQTFAWLEKARLEKSGGLESVKVVRPLEKWHSDPRYVALLKDLGLPQ